MALLSVAIVSAFGGAGRKKKPFRISKHSTSTLAEQEIAKQFEIRTDNQLLSSFSKHPWEAYESTLRLVVGGVVETGKKSKKPVDHAHTLAFLLSPLSLNDVPVPPALTATDPVAFRSGMEQQRQAFMVTNNLNEAQYQYAIRILTYMGDFCAKRGLAAPLRVAWYKLREAGMIPRENCISTYMYALSLDEETEVLSGEVAAFHDLLFEASENTVYLRIKSLVGKGNAVGAEVLLESLPVRSYASTLHSFFVFLVCVCCLTCNNIETKRVTTGGCYGHIPPFLNIIATLENSVPPCVCTDKCRHHPASISNRKHMPY